MPESISDLSNNCLLIKKCTPHKYEYTDTITYRWSCLDFYVITSAINEIIGQSTMGIKTANACNYHELMTELGIIIRAGIAK